MNNDPVNRVSIYFRSKAHQLLALAEQAICEHPGLVGGHREALHRLYLQEILPKRYEVGRGMVYGPAHKSKEADIVIWDSSNYPSLPMLDHSFFFAESVRVVLECKSNWSKENLDDVLEKCGAVKDILTLSAQDNLETTIDLIWQAINSLYTGKSHVGTLRTSWRIGTAAIFLKGGKRFRLKNLTKPQIADAHHSWPDTMLLLEAGVIVIKNEDPESSSGSLDLYKYDKDALLVFTDTLFKLLDNRIVKVEEPLTLKKYALNLLCVRPIETINFRYLCDPGGMKLQFWE